MLKPGIALTIGDKLYDRHAVAFRLRRTQLPALDRLEITLPRDVSFDAEPGEDCSLELDGGEGEAVVFTGTVTEVRRTLRSLELSAHNGGLKLSRYRPASSFEKMTVGEVIDALCSDASVDIADRVDGPTMALYVTDGRSTAAEAIAHLALDAGATGAFSGDNELHVTEDGGPGGEMALRYGRELIAAESGAIQGEYPSIAVVGEGGGSPTSPEGRWVIVDFLSGAGPDPGPEARIVPLPEIRSTDDATAAAAALTHRRTLALSPVRLKLWLNPAIEPGMRLELADMPDYLPLSECRVRELVSTYVPGGRMTTEVWASGNTAGASDLLGSLIGAIGSLL